MVDDANRQIRQTGQALGKQTHDDTLAGNSRLGRSRRLCLQL
jgi:hypothetical protein